VFAQITTFQFRSAAAPKVVSAFERDLLDRLRQVDGFLCGELFTRSRLNKGVAVFFWEDEYSAMKHLDSGASDEIWEILSPHLLGEPEMEGYEPNILRTGPGLVPGATDVRPSSRG
jgi:hypothetical protein